MHICIYIYTYIRTLSKRTYSYLHMHTCSHIHDTDPRTRNAKAIFDIMVCLPVFDVFRIYIHICIYLHVHSHISKHTYTYFYMHTCLHIYDTDSRTSSAKAIFDIVVCVPVFDVVHTHTVVAVIVLYRVRGTGKDTPGVCCCSVLQ